MDNIFPTMSSQNALEAYHSSRPYREQDHILWRDGAGREIADGAQNARRMTFAINRFGLQIVNWSIRTVQKELTVLVLLFASYSWPRRVWSNSNWRSQAA